MIKKNNICLKKITPQFIKVCLFLAISSLLSGCISHHVYNDFDEFVVESQGQFKHQKTDLLAEYQLTSKTENHEYDIQAATTGMANIWTVKFGSMLNEMLQSPDVQAAFKQLNPISGQPHTEDIKLTFDLVNYVFGGFGATVKMRIIAEQEFATLVDKVYQHKGNTHGAKMFFTGAFGMRSVVQDSTKSVIDKILADFLQDLVFAKATIESNAIITTPIEEFVTPKKEIILLPKKGKETNIQDGLNKPNQQQPPIQLSPQQSEPNTKPTLRQPSPLPENFEFQIEYYRE